MSYENAFTRPKKIVFCNNKGGVGKTTLLFNIAAEAYKQGLRVAVVDLDPQTNLTMNVIGENHADDLFNGSIKTIYDVLKGLETGTSDIDDTIVPYSINGDNRNLLIPGSLNLAGFEEKILNGAFTETANGGERGFRIVSAINRYLDKIGLDYKIDLFLIDTSPNLGSLNKTAILGSDFFVVPVNPNIFSVQGVENIGTTYSRWKSDWKNSQEYVGKGLPSELMLQNDPIFLGWIVNDYARYNDQPVQNQQHYIDKLKTTIKENLSTKLTKNGLQETTQNPVGIIQQFGNLLQRTHEAAIPVSYMNVSDISQPGSKDTFEHVKKEIEDTTKNIIDLAIKYQNA